MKTALITGGSKGIGYGIAEAMLKEKFSVAITGRNENALNQAVEKLKTSGGEVMGIACDVRDYSAQQKVVEQVVKKWKSLDVLVANAGVGNFAPIDEMTIDQWLQTIDTNLTGVFYSIKASVDALKKSKGYIITISSLAGTNFFATAAAYNASKFGLTGFTQAVMLDLRKYGIKVSTIMPGSVATDFDGMLSKTGESWKIQIEDLGQMVVDMLKLNPRTLPSKIEVRPSLPVKS
jgi:hypothetical protein